MFAVRPCPVRSGPGGRRPPRCRRPAWARSAAARPARRPPACARSAGRGWWPNPGRSPAGRPTPLSATVTVSRSCSRDRDDLEQAVVRPRRRGKPCCSAFCSSSVSTMASGVATAAGSSPNEPVIFGDHPDLGRGHLPGHHRDPVRDVVEVHDLIRRVRQRLVHDRDRPDPADRLVQRRPRLGRLQPPGLQPQQRGDGLQVVLHPVVDLPDRGVLGHQLALAAAQFGDVPDQDQGAGPAPADDQRDRAQLDHRAVRRPPRPPAAPGPRPPPSATRPAARPDAHSLRGRPRPAPRR